ncbi:hypothetical protein L208DRAFT_26120 [Tricholoma matsutake]|nr:hypothetical protein L208DRAFT_26120 [Tricholoma matsutake 945]
MYIHPSTKFVFAMMHRGRLVAFPQSRMMLLTLYFTIITFGIGLTNSSRQPNQLLKRLEILNAKKHHLLTACLS